ncbi:hypothetical protein [Rhodanobacter sp. DHG33]|uniref:hypothetical protein n=1 Tax=Rhodanobacter sp. DHG33 TaxID=2775921 RepID=UPI00177C15E8|nr:hypothetical protein [Rhodanobacter sp. DHG33]MBD8900021.1 hypothetical protein [Rhodanobacter sp. DHG33]
MLDVHALEKKIHGFKDFLLHIITITIGLLIALALEGAVEWKHHRDLVSEAESSLRSEIAHNISTLTSIRQQIKDEKKALDDDLAALSVLRDQPETADAAHKNMSFEFRIESFDDTAWRTSQTAGAFNYMPYENVAEFTNIYEAQDDVYKTQRQALNDILSAASLVVTKHNDEKLPTAVIDQVTDRIGMAQMRLYFLSGLVDSLEKTYQEYKSHHPEAFRTQVPAVHTAQPPSTT